MRDRVKSVPFLFLRVSIWLDKPRSGQINLFPAMNKLNQNRCYQPSRRQLLTGVAAASALALTPAVRATDPRGAGELPEAFAGLKPLGGRVRPITADEFHGRLQHAQKLMAELEPKYDALFVAPGTSLYYFTGIRWGTSERLLALVLPRAGDPIVVVPAFEEGRMREKLHFAAEVRTIACRGRKSDHELELMRLACEATFDVFRAVFASLKEGMSQEDIAKMVEGGFSKMGLRGEALVLLGASAALPHGTIKPQRLKDGDVVLIDGGCAVEGYQSDVTRTGVFGKTPEKVARVYETVRKAQDAALDAARAGRLSGTVDDAARKVITDSGYGPDYKFFTHRLGHGIGLDGHEHPYLVRGSKTVLEPGMTFSNEPGIYIPGEFGMRCEDDMVIAADGPAQLLTQRFAVSLEKPLG